MYYKPVSSVLFPPWIYHLIPSFHVDSLILVMKFPLSDRDQFLQFISLFRLLSPQRPPSPLPPWLSPEGGLAQAPSVGRAGAAVQPWQRRSGVSMEGGGRLWVGLGPPHPGPSWGLAGPVGRL